MNIFLTACQTVSVPSAWFNCIGDLALLHDQDGNSILF
jgi:hypothetical protein